MPTRPASSLALGVSPIVLYCSQEQACREQLRARRIRVRHGAARGKEEVPAGGVEARRVIPEAAACHLVRRARTERDEAHA